MLHYIIITTHLFLLIDLNMCGSCGRLDQTLQSVQAHMIVQQAMATPAEKSIAYHLRPILTEEGWRRLLLAVESEVHTFLADLAYYKLQYAIPTVKVNDQTFK
ncbi:hypothetical protein H4R35_006270, partial [Dimargaris xerosporica]